MRGLFFGLFAFFCVTSISAQKFVELDTFTQYRFPKLIYSENPLVEDKVNTFLQVKHLIKLPGKYETHPFEKVIDSRWVEEIYEYKSWKASTMHPNILAFQLNGKIQGKKPFSEYEYFDIRTGNSLVLADLFSEKGYSELQKIIGAERNFNISQDTIFINKTGFALDSLRGYFSKYGENLLYAAADSLIRESMRGKIYRGTGIAYGNRPIAYLICITKLEENGAATVFYWNEKYRSLEFYSDTIIKNDSLNAEDYIWDRRENKKFRTYHELKIKKQPDNTWVGMLMNGSPSYKLTFKEY